MTLRLLAAIAELIAGLLLAVVAYALLKVLWDIRHQIRWWEVVLALPTIAAALWAAWGSHPVFWQRMLIALTIQFVTLFGIHIATEGR
jgi:hypothetical protein